MPHNIFLEKQKSLLSDRDYGLVKKSTEILLGNINNQKTAPWYPYRCIMPSWEFNGIWNWDSAFHAIGVSHWDNDLAKEQVLGFIQYQCADGMYIDFIGADKRYNQCSSKPPLFAWAAARIYEKDKDVEFVRKVYASLVKNESFWTEFRMYKGLFHYDANTNITPFKEYDLNVRWESGWDNSVRWDNPCSDYWAIDLNCFMVMTYRGLSVLAEAIGEINDCKLWKAKEEILINNINTYLWNEALGYYADCNRFNNEASKILSPASFMPLYIKIAAEDRAKKMLEIAADKNKFYPAMPTAAYDDKQFSQDYWRGNTWLNVAYFAAKGLKNYGFDEVADGIKETILGWVYADETVHENYNSLTGEGIYHKNFSWSCVFVLEFLLNW